MGNPTIESLDEIPVILNIHPTKRIFTLPLDTEKIDLQGVQFSIEIATAVGYIAEELNNYYIGSKIDIVITKGEDHLANFSFLMEYSFLDKKNLIVKKEEQYTLNEDLVNYLCNTITDTSRGFIFAETRGTYLNDLIMPFFKF